MNGLPYMGSKRKLVKPIVDHIIKHNPNVKYFYDLFGGGGAISFYALRKQRIKKVFYNELNTGVVELLRDIFKNGVNEKYYQWVSREKFNECKNNDDWFAGLCKVIWSFGNNQVDYLYGKDTIPYKLMMHNAVVNKSLEAMIELDKINLTNCVKHHNRYGDDFHKNLTLLRSNFKSRKERDLQHLEHLQRLQHLEHLQRLEHLERLQSLRHLDKFQISNKSFDDLEISTPIDETIIYLDPPYINTKKYQQKISHNSLYEYIESSPYKIYMSGYESHLESVMEIDHHSLLGNTKKVVEKLFVNQPETVLKKYF